MALSSGFSTKLSNPVGIRLVLLGLVVAPRFLVLSCRGSMGRTEGKKKHRKAALLWNATQHSWVFYCSKKGRVECMGGKTLGSLISALNPALGEAYKRDRWHSGTVGKGHNCSVPKVCKLSGGLDNN